MIWVLYVLIVSFIDRDKPVEAIFDSEYFKKFVFDVFREPRNKEFWVFIELYHVLLMKRRPFVLLERIFIATLFATHLAIELVFP